MISYNSFSYFLVVLFLFGLCQILPKQRPMLLTLSTFVFSLLLFASMKKNWVYLHVFIVFQYGLLRLLQKSRSGYLLAFQITTALAFLGLFKYSFFYEPLAALLPSLKIFVKPLSFLGLSFFIFRFLSLAIDIYQDEEKEIGLKFFDTYTFLCFFPTFLMGPLDRYERFQGDLQGEAEVNYEQRYQHVRRIIWGLFKKVFIADSLISFSLLSLNPQDFSQLSTFQLYSSLFVYYWVLYFDFSGYCDVAIGVSKLLGIKTPENFNFPFLARNIQDFWQRWHISFMHWLKDYLYFPILKRLIDWGLKNTIAATSLSFFLTFLMAGVWHGDGWSFLIYGVVHGLGFALWFTYKELLRRRLGKQKFKAYNQHRGIQVASTVITFHFFLYSLLWFLGKHDIFIQRILL